MLLQQLDRIVEGQPFADAQRQLAFALQVFVNQEVFPVGVVLGGGDSPAGGVGQRNTRRRGGAAPGSAAAPWQTRALAPTRAGCPSARPARRDRSCRPAGAGVLPVTPAALQRRSVGDGDVPVDAHEDRRMPIGHHVDVLTRGQRLARPERVVPTAAAESIRRAPPGSPATPMRCCISAQRHASRRGRLQLLEAAARQMHVRIVEARHHEVSAEIDDLVWRCPSACGFRRSTDGDNASVTDRHGLRARRRRLGVDVAVDEDHVSVFACRQVPSRTPCCSSQVQKPMSRTPGLGR